MNRPIRLNVQDPSGEWATTIALGVRVNGHDIPFCYLADEAEGFAECVMHHADGSLMWFPDQDGGLRTCRYVGRVEIRTQDEAARAVLEDHFAVGG